MRDGNESEETCDDEAKTQLQISNLEEEESSSSPAMAR